jgi:hypothetical protein
MLADQCSPIPISFSATTSVRLRRQLGGVMRSSGLVAPKHCGFRAFDPLDDDRHPAIRSVCRVLHFAKLLVGVTANGSHTLRG